MSMSGTPSSAEILQRTSTTNEYNYSEADGPRRLDESSNSTRFSEGTMPSCKICDEELPCVFCNECRQGICRPCKNQHDKISGFDKHTSSPLCPKHFEPVTHLCHQCVEGMCIKCMMREHNSHDEHFTSLSEGVERLKGKSGEIVGTIRKQNRNISRKLRDIKLNLKKSGNIKESMKQLRAAYYQKITKIDKFLAYIEETYEKQGENEVRLLTQLESKLKDFLANVDWQYDCVLDFLKQFSTLTTEAESLISNIEGLLLDIKEESTENDFEMLLLETDKVIDWKEDCFADYCMTVDYRGDVVLTDISLLPDGSLAFFKGKPWKIVRMDPNGKVKPFLHQNNIFYNNDVYGMQVYNNYLHFLVGNKIYQMNLKSRAIETYSLPNSAFRFTVADQNTIVFSGNTSDKTLWLFNTQTKKAKVVGKNVTHSYSFTTSCKVDGIQFIIASATRGGFVDVFKENGELVSKLGSSESSTGKLCQPTGLAVTQHGDILVADRPKHRISCFSLDGTFQRHILTEKDGIYNPCLLAYKHPHLWIAESNFIAYKAIKCFQFQSESLSLSQNP